MPIIPEDYINTISDVEYYMNGGCYDFYLKLKDKFHNSKAYYDSNHVITKIGGKYYDATGEVLPVRHIDVETYYGHEHLLKEFNKI